LVSAVSDTLGANNIPFCLESILPNREETSALYAPSHQPRQFNTVQSFPSSPVQPHPTTKFKSSVCLHSSEPQHLLCDLWLLEWLGAVVWVFFAIADWHTSFADVAVSFVSKLSR
jgi:hypothetical protein